MIGDGTQIQPFSVVTPHTELQDGCELTPHAKASTRLSLSSAKGLAVAFSNVIPGAELSPYNHTIAQVCFSLRQRLTFKSEWLSAGKSSAFVNIESGVEVKSVLSSINHT